MSKCIQCGNIYSSEPETKTGLCFRCEIKQKDQQIAELEDVLEEFGIECAEELSIKLDIQERTIKRLSDYSRQVVAENEELKMFHGSDILINKLKQENLQLKQQLTEKDKEIEELKEKTKTIVSTAYYQLARTTEIIKLKEQLHTQPREIIEKIRKEMGNIEDVLINCGNGKEDALCWFSKILDQVERSEKDGRN